jgi:hypothetical protein
MVVTVKNIVSRLSWDPPGGERRLSAACRADVERWNNAVTKHEAHHVDDNKAVAADAAKAPAKSYRACGATTDEAKAKLKADLDAVAATQLDAMIAEAVRRRDAFHKTPAGGPVTDPSCEVCG